MIETEFIPNENNLNVVKTHFRQSQKKIITMGCVTFRPRKKYGRLVHKNTLYTKKTLKNINIQCLHIQLY